MGYSEKTGEFETKSSGNADEVNGYPVKLRYNFATVVLHELEIV